ncbi:hypothetical protein LDENG_00067620, partial [Lucifuga dentata]
ITTAAIRRRRAEDTNSTSAFESWAGRTGSLLLRATQPTTATASVPSHSTPT